MKNTPPDTLFNRLKTNLLNYITNRLKDSHLKELLKGSFTFFIFRIFGMVLAYVFILLITRQLGADAMGIFAISFTILLILSVIGRLGFDTALIRFVAEYSSKKRMDLVKEIYLKALKILVPFCILLSVLFFLCSPYIAKHIFNKEYLSVYFKVVSFAVLPMVLIYINSESLRGLKKIKEYSFLQNGSVYLFAIIILALSLLFTKEKLIPLISYIVGVIIVSALSIILWIRDSKLNLLPYKNTIKLKSLLSVSMPMLLTSSLFLILGWTDTLMLGMFRAEGEVGIYSIAFRVSSLMTITLVAINSIAAPKFAEFYGKRDMKGFGRIVRQSTKLIFWSSLPILLILLLFPSFILGIFGEEFKIGVYALLLLTVGQFISAISGSVGSILQMTGRQKVFQNIILLATIINIILNAVLIPKYGINGAAFASMISMIFWNLSSVVFINYYLKIKTYYSF